MPMDNLPFEPMSDELTKQRTYCVELNRNESRVIIERMKALLTFQGFLFAAVGVAAGQKLYAVASLISIVGALTCLPWFVSVKVSYGGNALLTQRFKDCTEGKCPPLDAVDIKPWQFYLLPEVFLPNIVAITWLLILANVVTKWMA